MLKAGAAADIIVMDYKPFNPFSDANIDGHMIFGMTGRQCQTTIAAGKTLMLDRELVGIDEEAENAHILEAAKKLLGQPQSLRVLRKHYIGGTTMSEKMYPIPFASLMNWVVTEYAQSGDIFGVHKKYEATGKSLPIFGERIGNAVRPRRRPQQPARAEHHRRLLRGRARFFEVKTVQKMDGAELAACVPCPCILAADEGYNQSGPPS